MTRERIRRALDKDKKLSKAIKPVQNVEKKVNKNLKRNLSKKQVDLFIEEE